MRYLLYSYTPKDEHPSQDSNAERTARRMYRREYTAPNTFRRNPVDKR